MGTLSRTISSAADKRDLIALIQGKTKPFTITVADGKKRSIEQNRLQRLWMIEVAEQLGEFTAEGYRGFCKLHFGVPILRMENDAFRLQYDKVVKPLSYEYKLLIMQEPIDLPVTRLMTTRQKTDYLDAVYQHFRGLGAQMTEPEGRL